MKTFSYVIVDDDSMYQVILNNFLQQYPFFEKSALFSSPVSAEKYLKENKVDILFSDIEMPHISGLSLLERVKDRVSYSVFITSHPEFAIDSYELYANDYILKPLDVEKMEKVVNRIKLFFETKENADLYKTIAPKNLIKIKAGHEHRLVDTNEIAYLMAVKDYTKVIISDNSAILTHGNLSTTLKDDKFNQFLRIHKSYAVNRNFVKGMKTNSIVLSNEMELPVGQAFKTAVLEAL